MKQICYLVQPSPPTEHFMQSGIPPPVTSSSGPIHPNFPKLLNFEEIIQRGIINFPAPGDLKLTNASLNLTVDKILTLKDDEVVEDFLIPPQGMVLVITNEILHLPDDVLGYTTVKNQLSLDGIMAVNIGIVDNGWKGPISSLLINFGSKNHRIKKGQVFLRMTFHEFSIPAAPKQNPFKVYNKEEYLAQRLKDAKANLASTFLTIDKIRKTIRKKVIISFWKYVGATGAVLAVLTGIFFFFQTIKDSYVGYQKYLNQMENLPMVKKVDSLILRDKAREHELKNMRLQNATQNKKIDSLIKIQNDRTQQILELLQKKDEPSRTTNK